MAKKSQDRVINDAANLLRQYYAEGGHNADLLRAAADSVVELRSRFTRKNDGGTDWGGRTTDYRDAIAEVYSRAGLDPDRISHLQGKFAYHVRKALDARVPAEELAAAGFGVDSPKEKQTRKRTSDAAIAAAFAPDTTAMHRVVFAERLLAQAADEDVTDLPASNLDAISKALDAVDDHAAVIRAAVSGE